RASFDGSAGSIPVSDPAPTNPRPSADEPSPLLLATRTALGTVQPRPLWREVLRPVAPKRLGRDRGNGRSARRSSRERGRAGRRTPRATTVDPKARRTAGRSSRPPRRSDFPRKAPSSLPYDAPDETPGNQG